jgi:hypothetical protein
MEQFEGIVSELGDAAIVGTGEGSRSTYTFVEIGDTMLRGLKVLSGIDGKLVSACRSGERVTLYRKNDWLIGIKFSNGKTYGSAIPSSYAEVIAFAIIGVLTVMLLIGFVFLALAWQYWQAASARSAAESLPNVMMI